MIQFSDRSEIIQEYYFSKKLRELNNLLESGKPIINIGIGNPDLKPPLAVVNALKLSLTNINAHKYQSYQGIFEFRKAIVEFYNKNFFVNLNPNDEVLPLIGSKEGILHISMALLNYGDGVLIPNPGYPTYSSVTKLIGARPIYYTLDENNQYQPNFKELENKDLSKIKLMWVNYPNMPTGAKATKETFEKLIKFGKKNNILIVNDNPYSFILNDLPNSILQINGAKDIALELNSMSKSFNMAGWRVGMLLGNSYFLSKILKIKTQQESGMFYAVQKGAIAALNTQKKWFTDINKEYTERRNLIWKLADKLNCTYKKNTSGMFVWAKLPLGKNSFSFVDELLYEKNIFVAPGSIFGSNGNGFTRFSLCVEKNKIKQAIKRI